MNPKERTHLDGKATKCDYLRRKNKLLSKSRELKRLSDLLMLELKVREKWNIRTTSCVSIRCQIDFWSTRMMSIWCLFDIFCCKVKKLSDLLMLELKVGESEISKWHHLHRSEVRFTSDQRTWCQFSLSNCFRLASKSIFIDPKSKCRWLFMLLFYLAKYLTHSS